MMPSIIFTCSHPINWIAFYEKMIGIVPPGRPPHLQEDLLVYRMVTEGYLKDWNNYIVKACHGE